MEIVISPEGLIPEILKNRLSFVLTLFLLRLPLKANCTQLMRYISYQFKNPTIFQHDD